LRRESETKRERERERERVEIFHKKKNLVRNCHIYRVIIQIESNLREREREIVERT